MNNLHYNTAIFICTNYFALRAFLMPLVLMLDSVETIHVIVNLSRDEEAKIKSEFGQHINIKIMQIERAPNLWYDFKALMELISFFSQVRPKLVFSIMPKTGLLAMVAAFCCGIEHRIHVFTGQVWFTKRSYKKKFYKLIDMLVAKLATCLLTDGSGQREFLIDEGVVSPEKINIIWNGSICGINFANKKNRISVSKNLRSELGFDEDDFVILFMSRMTSEKGFKEVIQMYSILSNRSAKIRLLLVGPDEEGLIENLSLDATIKFEHIPYVNEIEQYIKVCDVFVSPSFREGLPMTLLQALSLEAVTFVSDIYGNNDLVTHGHNGFLHPPGDWQMLADQVWSFHEGELKTTSGTIGKDIVAKYDRGVFSEHFREFIKQKLD